MVMLPRLETVPGVLGAVISTWEGGTIEEIGDVDGGAVAQAIALTADSMGLAGELLRLGTLRKVVVTGTATSGVVICGPETLTIGFTADTKSLMTLEKLLEQSARSPCVSSVASPPPPPPIAPVTPSAPDASAPDRCAPVGSALKGPPALTLNHHRHPDPKAVGALRLWDRRLPRRLHRVCLLVRPEIGGPTVTAFSHDISEGGIFIACEPSWEVGSQLQLELPVGDESYAVVGRVVWRRVTTDAPEERPIGMGLEFVRPSTEMLGCLRELVGLCDRETHAVRVLLPGLSQRVAVRALLTNSGLLLKAPFPFLQLEGRVAFSFVGSERQYEGAIADVRIAVDDSTSLPQLLVDVKLPVFEDAEANDPKKTSDYPPKLLKSSRGD